MTAFPVQVCIKNNNHAEKLPQWIGKSFVFDSHAGSSSLSSQPFQNLPDWKLVGLVFPPARAGMGEQGRARVTAGKGFNRGPLCPALQKSKASSRNPCSSPPAPPVCGAGCGSFLFLLLLLPARTMCRAPAVLPRAGEPLPLPPWPGALPSPLRRPQTFLCSVRQWKYPQQD